MLDAPPRLQAPLSGDRGCLEASVRSLCFAPGLMLKVVMETTSGCLVLMQSEHHSNTVVVPSFVSHAAALL